MILGSSFLGLLSRGSPLGKIALLAEVKDGKGIRLTKSCIDLIKFSNKKIKLDRFFRLSRYRSYILVLKNIGGPHFCLIGSKLLKSNQNKLYYFGGGDNVAKNILILINQGNFVFIKDSNVNSLSHLFLPILNLK